MITRGSEWRRWEPHIHAPGTVLNNQFGGVDPWSPYLSSLELGTPRIEAIAATDYYVTDTYEQIVEFKKAGRLADVALIFPNIEIRLDVTARKGYVNLHLLISPEDPEHLVEVGRILKRLQFHAYDDDFDCSRAELIRLGRRADPTKTDDRAALAHGVTQFRVNFAQLRKVLKDSDWAKKNILVAVAGGADDGTSGLRQAADATVRQEIEKFADIIFASSIAQREFWLGKRGLSVAELQDGYEGCKPCLHGSDAHDQASVGQPDGNRYSWIKGALTFDALRQACIDPAGRAYVGTEPPISAMPSQVISTVAIADASWAATPVVPLNTGLVAIIGARGSGKTALADMIAAGCDAIPLAAWKADENISPSFLVRARPLIGAAQATLTWGGGTAITRHLDGRDADDPFAFPRARYLSQQFVEELCSAKGASEGLIREVERVIFEAHPRDQRDGATNFAQLRERRTLRFQQARQREAEAIAAISERIAEEFEKEALVTPLTNQAAQKKILVAGYTADLAKLVVKGTEAQAARHGQLNLAAQTVNATIQRYANQRRTFVAMQDEVRSTKATKAPEMLRQAQARHTNSGLNSTQWADFLLIYKGDVDAALSGYIHWADGEIAKLKGVPPPPPADPNLPLIADGVDLATLPLTLLQVEMGRLEQLISADQVVRGQYTALSTRIAQENSELQGIETRVTDAQGAAARRKDLQAEREAAYGRVFDALVAEQAALAALYAPLMTRLAAAPGTLGKLSFSVTRVVDAAGWGNVAENDIIDCRKAGPFYGRGSLIALAEQVLKPAWQTGSSADVQAAMSGFIADYTGPLFAHAPYAPTQQAEFRTWAKSFAHWLFGTGHISVRYEIAYDGVDIRKLSPGTRGIVLLLLYLALDDADDRPLIIDQPEENLDPKSVFDELVSLFIVAKAKRQVIMVTHNANLVINTDADQIIVAECGAHRSGGLPPITYVAGGLEDEDIRKAVCDILEGGEQAFRERARRLRVRLKR
ncbi:TrlF family AAA-like ATPase [Sphingomonas sp.]|uniref:TrlF family AAA-like ATPase n=1 Tax=Sphingomonas sp. TaxID=28214 RepID=UPI000DB0E395|nr:MAG: phosphotransferase [Sphingomonas sp.]